MFANKSSLRNLSLRHGIFEDLHTHILNELAYRIIRFRLFDHGLQSCLHCRMIFEAFEWPPSSNGLNVEINPQTWEIIKFSERALHSAHNPIRGKWCYIQNKPFFMVQQKNNILISFNGKTWSIPQGSSDFIITEYNLFFWKKFILKKGKEIILNCIYRDPDTLILSLMSAFVFDDIYFDNPFNDFKTHLNS